MAMDALILACESVLQSYFYWDDLTCTAQLVPNPPPYSGQLAVTVSPGGVEQTDDNPLSLDERYAVVVAMTHRLAFAPADRKARQALLASEVGAVPLGNRVGALLHGNYDVLNAANDLIPGFAADTNGFVEPLHLQGIRYQAVGPEWVGAEPDDGDPVSLYLVTVTLGGARRVRVMGTAG